MGLRETRWNQLCRHTGGKRTAPMWIWVGGATAKIEVACSAAAPRAAGGTSDSSAWFNRHRP